MVARFFSLLMGVGLVLAGGFSGCSLDRTPRPIPSNEGGGAGDPPAAGGTSSGSGGSCSLGATRCDDLLPERCSELRTWVPARASCAIACLGGECVECVEDATICRDGAVQRCVSGVWSTDKVCEKTCQGDACVDACTEGLYQCNGARSLQKCVAGIFVDDTACDVLCTSNACSGVCTPDTRRCNPDALGESQVCNAQGNWDQSAPCASGTFCVAGDCKACSPGTYRCSDAIPQLCSDTGEWVNQGTCTGANGVCFDGRCVACTPGEKRCRDNAVEQCMTDGSNWEVFDTCGGDTPACLESTKSCGKCSEGEAQCLDDGVQTCDDEGVFQTTETCSGSTPRCVEQACTECDPTAGERRCASSGSTQACNADGTWAEAVDCAGDTPECRDDLGFNCGCEESARRCRTSSVPEQCQGGAWVAQAACSGTLNHCLAASGECVDCSPDATECRSGVAHQCNAEGSFESLNSCSGPGINCGNCNLGEVCGQTSDCKTGYCVNGRCAVCQPDARECVGATPRLCSSDGAWVNQTGCSGSTPECLPSTGQCVACLNGATRSCGNCNTGNQTCANNQWGSCSGAVDLNTSEQYCGSCNNSCSTSQVCESGTCVVDCGNLSRCGTACVNLSTDTSNCLSCGNRCNPPAANGSAVCASSGCDISCNNTRCGTTCCDATPVRSSAGCSGNTCAFTCSSGNHGCGSSTPPCYSNTDGSHCGSSCLNCGAYVGTTGACGSNQCTCENSTALACGASVPTCGSWDFNSNSVEGWRFGDYYTDSDHRWVGSLGTTVTNGSAALSAQFNGASQGGGIAEFEVDLCPNGAILNLANFALSYDVYFLTTGGTRFSQDPSDATDSFLASNRTVLTGCQPFLDPGSDAWLNGQCSNLPSSATNLTIIFRLSTGWAGTIFLDNVRFTPN